jgi:hypothetical protein
MRADLAHAALDQDLQMTASADQAEVSNVRQLTKELNEPPCPIWEGCRSVGTAPRSEAARRSTGAGSLGSGSSCAVTPSNDTTFCAAAIGLGMVAIVQGRRRRQR